MVNLSIKAQKAETSTVKAKATHLHFFAEVLLFGLARLEALLRPQQFLFPLLYRLLHLTLLDAHLERSKRGGTS